MRNKIPMQKSNLMTKGRFLIFSLLVFGIFLQITAQTNVIPPTPNAHQLTRFEAQQPDLYSGAASVSVPLYAIDFDGWSLPISINYSASGIRANQEASEIGLGWALSATAMISRTVKRGDDLQDDSFGKGYAFDTRPINEAIVVGSGLHQALENGLVDSEPDIYSYNFFGYSGSFLFKKKALASDPLEIVELKKDATKITYDDQAETFTILTPTGFKGVFSVKERSTSASGSAKGELPETWNSEQNFEDVTSLQNSGRYRRISSWYLKTITSPNEKQITFNYDLETDGSSQYHSISHPAWGETDDANEPMSVTIHEHAYLSSITITGELSITFSMTVRDDLFENDYLYTSYRPAFLSALPAKRYIGMNVQSLVTSNFIKSIQFGQTYFNEQYREPGETLEEARHLRLRLDKVSIDDQDYRFVYYEGVDGLPNKTSFQVDHFGFYNGRVGGNQKLYKPPFANLFNLTSYQDFADVTYRHRNEMKANVNYGVAASLKKVIYPTKGYTEFTYEAQNYYVEGISTGYGAEAVDAAGVAGDVSAGGIRIQSIASFDQNSTEVSRKNYYYDKVNGNSSGSLLTPLGNLFYAEILGGWSFKTLGPTIPNSDGPRVGYSRVIEESVGGATTFSTTYDFVNIPAVFTPEELVQVGDSPYMQYAHKNGKRLNEFSKDASGTDKSSREISYLEDVQTGIFGLVYQNWPCGPSGCNIAMTYFLYNVPVIFMEPQTIVSTSYQSSGNLQSTETLSYNDDGQLVSRQMVNSAQKAILDEYTYPNGIATPSAAIVEMKVDNQLQPVIETRKYVNGQIVSAMGNEYDLEDGNVVLRKIHEFNRDKGAFIGTTNGATFSGGYEEKIHFVSYDTHGRILEYQGRDGVANSFIWENNYPVAKGVGITNANLQTAYTAAQGASFEDNIRTHSLTQNGLVSTYDYQELVGMSATTSPAKEAYIYSYDVNERLTDVSLELGSTSNIISAYEYNFVSANERILDIDLLSNTANFGTVAPNESAVEEIPLTNNGDTDLIALFVLPSNFSSPINGALIPPETTLLFPLVYTAPDVSGSSNVSEDIDLQSVGQTVTGELSFTANATIAPHERVPEPVEDCYEIIYGFTSATVQIENTGNSSLTIHTGVSDDSNVTVPGSFPRVILPNQKLSITAQLNSSIGNWDNHAKLTFTSDRTDLPGAPTTIDIKFDCNN